MSGEYTPGPYEIWSDMDSAIVIVSRVNGFAPIAYVAPINRNLPIDTISEFDGSGSVPSEEERANGNLLVAAPDLLAACEAVLTEQERGQLISTYAFNQVKAAIAKARGLQ